MFCLFSRDFRGSEETENPCFLVGFVAFSQKGKERKIREDECNGKLPAQNPWGHQDQRGRDGGREGGSVTCQTTQVTQAMSCLQAVVFEDRAHTKGVMQPHASEKGS